MTSPFDFAAWLQATGWSNAEAARRLGLTRETVARMAAGTGPVTGKTEVRCRAVTAQQIEALRQFTAG